MSGFRDLEQPSAGARVQEADDVQVRRGRREPVELTSTPASSPAVVQPASRSHSKAPEALNAW